MHERGTTSNDGVGRSQVVLHISHASGAMLHQMLYQMLYPSHTDMYVCILCIYIHTYMYAYKHTQGAMLYELLYQMHRIHASHRTYQMH